ncbi:carbohydrate-binding module family 18 protein [Piromyces sp. E2]|nr:carbohydrate-binding module family 18 protein [Piromyces sp. E2]|eukprot:OUM63495.1 carbohydrate-binding module family 18 protein [Piromyces sp. E2]
MSQEDIDRLNGLLSNLGSQFNENIQIPYIYFDDSAITGKSYNSENILTVTRSTSTGANFAAALDKAIEFYGKYGYKKNRKQNNIVIYTAGNVAPTSVENSFGEALANAIEKANTLKSNGCKIYTLNVNNAANSGSEIAAINTTLNYNDINTVMELLSSDYDNVNVDSNGVVKGYSKASSDYYRTPKSNDYTALYTDILQNTMTGTENAKCSVSGGCEAEFGRECITITATIAATTTTEKPTPTVLISTDGSCGSVNGAQCLAAQCCNSGHCENMYDYTGTDDYNQNVLLLLDNSSVNMNEEQIGKLNQLLANLGSQFNEDIEIPYVLFNDAATSYRSYTSENILTVRSVTSTGANFASGLQKAIEFFTRYGKKKNGKENVVVIYSAGNIVQTSSESSFGVGLANAIEKANTLKESGVKIYTLNVNDSAQAGSTIAVPGKSISKRDINTVMELLSSDYTGVVVKSNGIIEDYTKSGSGYYRTPETNDYTALYTDILQATVTGVKNTQCEASNGCEFGFGPCEGINVITTTTTTTKPTITTTTTITITTTSTISSVETPSEIRCGEGIGSCPEGQCCSKDGYCGTTESYCYSSLGCQQDYGANCKCGENGGECDDGLCCSGSGYCGITRSFCYASLGCQADYGLCKFYK